VRRFLWDGREISREEAAEVLRGGIDSFARTRFGFWGVRITGAEELIGFCGLRFIADSRDVEILYGIHPRLWGRGYATEAAHAVLRWAFREAGVARIFAGADPPNDASFRVMEKLGMRFHGKRQTAAGLTPYWVIDREEV
jgi:[ribosomal protein S5]-alanine N-acetyltransferase